jgi:hypothetical protein
LLGEAQSADSLRRCLGCHTTSPRAVLGRTGPEAADRGIGCERCHGPGGHHIAAVELSFPDQAVTRFRRTASGTRPTVMALCGGCHGTTGRAMPQDTPAATVRFQATTLPWSRCFQEGRGALDCLTCHDAHRSGDEPPAFFEAKCLTCHSTVGTETGTGPGAACPVNPRADCLSCHMPKVPSIVPHVTFTDHYIRVRKDPDPSAPPAAGAPASPPPENGRRP